MDMVVGGGAETALIICLCAGQTALSVLLVLFLFSPRSRHRVIAPLAFANAGIITLLGTIPSSIVLYANGHTVACRVAAAMKSGTDGAWSLAIFTQMFEFTRYTVNTRTPVTEPARTITFLSALFLMLPYLVFGVFSIAAAQVLLAQASLTSSLAGCDPPANVFFSVVVAFQLVVLALIIACHGFNISLVVRSRPYTKSRIQALGQYSLSQPVIWSIFGFIYTIFRSTALSQRSQSRIASLVWVPVPLVFFSVFGPRIITNVLRISKGNSPSSEGEPTLPVNSTLTPASMTTFPNESSSTLGQALANFKQRPHRASSSSPMSYSPRPNQRDFSGVASPRLSRIAKPRLELKLVRSGSVAASISDSQKRTSVYAESHSNPPLPSPRPPPRLTHTDGDGPPSLPLPAEVTSRFEDSLETWTRNQKAKRTKRYISFLSLESSEGVLTSASKSSSSRHSQTSVNSSPFEAEVLNLKHEASLGPAIQPDGDDIRLHSKIHMPSQPGELATNNSIAAGKRMPNSLYPAMSMAQRFSWTSRGIQPSTNSSFLAQSNRNSNTSNDLSIPYDARRGDSSTSSDLSLAFRPSSHASQSFFFQFKGNDLTRPTSVLTPTPSNPSFDRSATRNLGVDLARFPVSPSFNADFSSASATAGRNSVLPDEVPTHVRESVKTQPPPALRHSLYYLARPSEHESGAS